MPFPVLMSHDEWKKRTAGGVLCRRSDALVEVDTAIQTYEHERNQENLDDLKVKFYYWCRSKEDFTQSVRNTGSQAPWELHLKLFMTGRSDASALRELAELRAMQQGLCAQMFWGCNMRFKSRLETAKGFISDVKSLLEQMGIKGISVPDIVRRIINGILGHFAPVGKAISSALSPINTIINRVIDFFKQLVKTLAIPVQTFIELVKKEILSLVERLIGHLLPMANALEFVTTFGPGVYHLVKKQVSVFNSNRARRFASDGDPRGAFDQLHLLLKSERNALAGELSASAIKALVDGVMPMASQAVAWADDFRKTLQSIITTIRQCMEMKKANKIFRQINASMTSSSFDLSIFGVSPLIASHVISSASQSQLVAMMPGDTTGFATWIKYTHLVIDKHIKPMQAEARRIIDEHPCKIENIGDEYRLHLAGQTELMRTAMVEHHEKSKDYLAAIPRTALLSAIRRSDTGSLAPVTPHLGKTTGLLDDITWFNQKALKKATTRTGQTTGVLDEVTWFKKEKLNAASTREINPAMEMRKFELALKQVNNQILAQTWLNHQAFSGIRLGDKVIDLSQWKKLSWVRFGRRHEFTRSIDKGLVGYSQLFQVNRSKYGQGALTKDKLKACLEDIKARIHYLMNQLLKPLHTWLDPKNKVHQTSKRLTAMTRLRELIDKEVDNLSRLHSEYSTKSRQAQLLYA
ncbi:hypothetical protein [Thalassomonas sp. RHCl1]|uniref:hypothetical protein n=1 Tax=Thalassomonas sp. RHCl1 TaxID=2995320 RepID=UPI00248AB681|nr:hypothetical protein [Thalassomonas sp. RHCl1]